MNYYEYIEFNGAKLFTLIFLPKAEGKFPVVIQRCPYVKKRPEQEECDRREMKLKKWLDNGYAVVYQHCRGCGSSEGDFIPHINERADSLNLYDWVRNQPFYNGELYLVGASYTSFVHYAAAPFAEDIKG